MVRKETNNEWTTIRVHKDTKAELLTHLVGRETDDEVLKRVLKFQKKTAQKVEKKEAEYLNKLDNKRMRKR